MEGILFIEHITSLLQHMLVFLGLAYLFTKTLVFTTLANNTLSLPDKVVIYFVFSGFCILGTVFSEPSVQSDDAIVNTRAIGAVLGGLLGGPVVGFLVGLTGGRSAPAHVTSHHVVTVIRGYMSEDKSSAIIRKTNLPYVNSCSTKQVFPPERLGDPTLQLLDIPPYSTEQAHHIHSTVRVAYILSGTGRSIVGMGEHYVTEKLYHGKTVIPQKCVHIILRRMAPI